MSTPNEAAQLRNSVGLAIDALNEIPCNLYEAFKVLHHALGHDYGDEDLHRMVNLVHDSLDDEEPPF